MDSSAATGALFCLVHEKISSLIASFNEFVFSSVCVSHIDMLGYECMTLRITMTYLGGEVAIYMHVGAQQYESRRWTSRPHQRNLKGP